MKLPPSIQETLKAIKRLIQQGATEGEKNAAKTALKRLMDKHGLTDEDLREEKRKFFAIAMPKHGHDDNLRFLVIQLLAKFAPSCNSNSASCKIPKVRGLSSGWELLAIEMTLVEHADYKDAENHYVRDFIKQRTEFTHAYIHAQNLAVAVSKEEAKPMSEAVSRKFSAVDRNSPLKSLTR